MRSVPHPLLVPLLAVALYGVTLGGTFVYDDVAVVLKDRRIGDPRLWGQYWTDSYNFGVDNLYRPIVSMTYAVQHRLHGDTAWPYHLVNVLLHAMASAMVGWFAYHLSARTISRDATPSPVLATSEDQRRRCVADHGDPCTIALVADVLFAAHPVHVEAVANVVGRAELLCAIGTLGAVGLAMAPLTPRRVAAITGFFLLALLSKEQGMLVPLMVGVVRLAMPNVECRTPNGDASTGAQTPSRSLLGIRHSAFGISPALLFVGLTLPLAAYVFLKENVLGLKFWWDRGFLDPWIQPLADSAGWDRLLVPVAIAGRYLGLLVAPVTLRIDYGGPIVPGAFHANDPYFWLGVVAIIGWIGLFAWASHRRDRFALVSLALLAISYAVVSNVLTIIGVNVAERLMYLPSAFFLLLVARGVAAWPRRVAVAFVVLVTLGFSIRTTTYAVRWNDRLRFYEYATAVEPRSIKAILLTMTEHADRGDLIAAEAWGRRAVAVEPNYQDAWLLLADVRLSLGDFDAAQEALDRARTIRMTGKVAGLTHRLNAARAATRPATTPTGGPS